MTTSSLTWVTPAGSIGVFLESTVLSKQFVATPGNLSNTVRYTLLNGNLPVSGATPITLSTGGLLYGELGQVYTDTTTAFTIRATEYSGSTAVAVRDRTFTIKVTGITAPYFTNASGSLFTTNDSVWQAFQMSYVNPDPTSAVTVHLINGSLPPGLEINSAGLIRGYATPPVDVANNPTTKTYTFSLQLSSSTGTTLPVSYSITVVNQETLSGFVGRNPTLLNTRPLTYTISSDDPYSAYYLTTNSLGDFVQDNNFLFKFIGYDFDAPTQNNTLTYDINGLETIGISNSVLTGWQSGILPNIGVSIQTYNVTARVYKTADPSLSSNTFLLTITVVGDIDTNITWITAQNLGVINNGSISDKVISAVNATNLDLSYRLIGSSIISNLTTVLKTNTAVEAFGYQGAHITDNGTDTWTQLPSINTTLSTYTFTSSVYDAVNSITILAGYDQSNNVVIGTLTADNIWTPSAVTTSSPINSIVTNGSLYVAVGQNGTITTTNDYNLWTQVPMSGVTDTLNSVCWDGTQFVAVGNLGTILTSPDGVTWTKRSNLNVQDLNSVYYTNTNLVAVGNFGTILISGDGIIWNDVSTANNNNLNSVVSNNQANNVTIAVGHNGTILRSTNHGVNWTSVNNTVTSTDLVDSIYDLDNDIFYSVGDVGTIINYTYDSTTQVETVSSPTLYRLPPNLQLLANGEITGRLAFESTDNIVQQGTSKTYTFSVQAYSPTLSDINSIKQFTLTTYQLFNTPYDNLYIQCYPDAKDQNIINSLLSDGAIIPTADLYRADDLYFGKATAVVYQHMFGVPTVPNDEFYTVYLPAVMRNFYWKNIVLGELKTAVARDSDNNIIYEVVYSEVIDNLINPQGVSINKEIVWPRSIKIDNSNWWTSTTDILSNNDNLYTSLSSELSRELFPNSLPNMRTQIAETVGFVNNDNILPAWMTSQQVNGSVLGYTQAWVICYTKPGKSAQIKTNIETQWAYKLNQIDFQVDRFEVDRSVTYNYTGLDISEQPTWATLPSAEPFPTPTNSEDKYVYFPRKTILPEVGTP